MRIKHKVFGSKGEIFRKDFCQPSSETESGEELVETRTEQKETLNKRKRRKRTKKESNDKRKSKQSQKDFRQKMEESGTRSKLHGLPGISSAFSVISKNRITSSIGIYNKFKTSNTAQRETTKQRLSKKDLEEKTKADLSKVLDFSPVNYNSPGSGSLHIASHTKQENSKSHPGSSSNNISSGSMANVGSITASQTKNLSFERKELPFKTPLHEISENLIQSLQPAKTFHGRDYLSEVKEQLRKLHRQSCALFNVDQSKSDATLSQRQSLKRKQVIAKEKPEEKHINFMEINTFPTASNAPRNEAEMRPFTYNLKGTSCKGVTEPALPLSTNMENEVKVLDQNEQNTTKQSDKAAGILENEAAEISNLEIDVIEKQHFHQPNLITSTTDKCNASNNNRTLAKCRRKSDQSDKYFLESHRGNSEANHAYDLLDFLDHIGPSTSTASKPSIPYSHLSPELSLVSMISLPRKPKVDSLSPQQQFYPRKLYS